jgi:hypothetical protein
MALAEMSTTDKNAVGAIDKPVQKKRSVYAPGTHDPDYPDMGWILKPRHPGRISGGITAPVAKEA